MTDKPMSDAKPKGPLIGYMILESHCDDFSDWDGVITGPRDPTGSNLAWENPIKMIKYSAYEAKVKEVDTLKAELEAKDTFYARWVLAREERRAALQMIREMRESMRRHLNATNEEPVDRNNLLREAIQAADEFMEGKDAT